MKLKTLAGALSFAQLLSPARAPLAAARAEEDDERKQREDESDEDYARRMEEMDDQEEEARRAEEEKEKEDARRAAAEDDDDGDDETDDAKKAARAAERARCARIVAHGIKIGAVRQSGVFAFDTKMSSQAAIAALDAGKADTPAPKRTGLADRMATTRVPNPGAEGSGAAPSLAQQILLADKKRRGQA